MRITAVIACAVVTGVMWASFMALIETKDATHLAAALVCLAYLYKQNQINRTDRFLLLIKAQFADIRSMVKRDEDMHKDCLHAMCIDCKAKAEQIEELSKSPFMEAVRVAELKREQEDTR